MLLISHSYNNILTIKNCNKSPNTVVKVLAKYFNKLSPNIVIKTVVKLLSSNTLTNGNTKKCVAV